MMIHRWRDIRAALANRRQQFPLTMAFLDLHEYAMTADRRQALKELTQMAQEMGGY